MPDTVFARRGFLKVSGAATAAAAVGGHSRILHALVTAQNTDKPGNATKRYSICDMCFNKCGLIAKVDNHGVVTKLDPLGEASAGLGIEVGDLILSVQSVPVSSGQALLDALNEEALAAGVRIRIQSVRTRESRTVYLEISR